MLTGGSSATCGYRRLMKGHAAMYNSERGVWSIERTSIGELVVLRDTLVREAYYEQFCLPAS